MSEHSIAGQVVLMSIFRFRGMNKVWGLSQLGMLPPKLKKLEHLSFFKVLGTGGGLGYSGRPDFSQYALLTVWTSAERGQDFFQNAEIMRTYRLKCDEIFTVVLRPLRSRGRWSGLEPFIPQQPVGSGTPVAVITRARLKWSFIVSFWKRVGAVSRSQKKYKQIYSQGVGEWPWLFQSTFSIWDSVEEMERFAHTQNEAHMDAIRITRQKKGFSEELYARFQVVGSEGTIGGVNPLPEHLQNFWALSVAH
jgi:heme-degrading monooxygenase HmoA